MQECEEFFPVLSLIYCYKAGHLTEIASFHALCPSYCSLVTFNIMRQNYIFYPETLLLRLRPDGATLLRGKPMAWDVTVPRHMFHLASRHNDESCMSQSRDSIRQHDRQIHKTHDDSHLSIPAVVETGDTWCSSAIEFILSNLKYYTQPCGLPKPATMAAFFAGPLGKRE